MAVRRLMRPLHAPHAATRPRTALRQLMLGLITGLSAGHLLAAPVGLMQAFEAARQFDPVFRGARAERDVGREYEAVARAALLPAINGLYNTSNNRADVAQADNAPEQRQYKGYNASLQLRQALYHPEAKAAHRQGQARTAASEARFAVQEQDLILRVFDAYASVLFQQEQLGLAQTQLATLTEQHRANQRLLAKGEGTRTEVLETQAKLDVARTQVVDMQDLVDTARHRLASLTGLPAPEPAPLSPGFDGPIEAQPSLAALIDTAQSAHPLLLGLRRDVDAAREDVRRAQAGHQPRVDLVVTAGQAESDSVTSFRQKNQTTSVGLQVNVPLYAGGGVQAQIRQALARQQQLEALLEARTAELVVELQRQHQLQHSSGLRLVALGQAVASAQLLVEATRKSVAGGVRTNLDVLNAQERLTQTLRDLAQTRYAHLQTTLRLRSTAGTLSEADLRQVASRFLSPP